jgi:hypothetical protein
MGRLPYCEKMGLRIIGDSENPVNPAMVQFPEWCPLETVAAGRTSNGSYKKEIRQIMRIMEDAPGADAIIEASHYLNSVIENAKKEAKAD